MKTSHVIRGIFFASLLMARELFATISVTDLRCEYYANPLGIDSTQPHLSWVPQSNVQGDNQTGYRVLVASTQTLLNSGTGDLWDSGQVTSNANFQITYAGQALQTAQQVYWKVMLWDGSGTPTAWSTNATWTTGILTTNAWVGQWITPNTNATDVGSSLLQKTFVVNAGLQRALVFVCGLGQYELSINGSKVGTNFLTPGWSMYTKTCLYDTYDITSMLQTGTNATGLWLGNGMYNIPSSSRYAKFTDSFGPRRAIAQIVLQYTNGTSTNIGTDGTWRCNSGPITFNTIFGGEAYDARQEIAGWNTATFNDSGWPSVRVTNGPGGVLRGTLYGAPPIQAQQVYTPTNSWVIGTADTVYDFGQNGSQIPTITVTGPAGSSVTLTPSELINANHTLNQIVSPTYMTYTLKGSGTETFTPRFYYFGYRYLGVQLNNSSGGTSGTLPTLVSLTSTAEYSSSDSIGSFSSSQASFTNIHNLVLWAQRNDSVSLFTDCPTREKTGWLEQDYLNGPALRYERNLNALFKATENKMADSQLSDGLVPDYAPDFTVYSGGFYDSPEWSSAVVQIPWQQYQYSGDTISFSQYYTTMKAYVAYLGSQASGNIVNYGLGDWYDLGPGSLGQSQLTPPSLTATATYYLDVTELAQMAALLGNTNDVNTYSQLASNIFTAFNNLLYNPSGYYATNSNTSDAMPLEIGLVPANDVSNVLNSLVQKISSQGNAWTSGDIGFRYLLRALADNNRSDVIFNMINRTNFPGYNYILSQGATSLTEGWDGSGSQDHFMLGQIMEWFYHDLAGIQSDPNGPGFSKIIIKPAVVGNVTWVNAGYYSVHGSISNYWVLNSNSNQLMMNVTIPVGSTATVYVPTLGTGVSNLVVAESGTAIWQNGAPTGSVPGVVYENTVNGSLSSQTYIVFGVGSGTYQFSAQLFLPPSGLSASAGLGQVALTWNAATGATSYNVNRSLTSGANYTTVAANYAGTNYVDAGLSNNTTYYYVVSAANAGGESANSSEVNATPGYLANFGFETPSISTYEYGLSGGAWTFDASTNAGGSGISANGSAFTSGNPNAPQGVQVAFLQGTGTISQSFSGLVSGAIYQITFYAAQRNNIYGAQLGQTWQLSMDGTTIGTYAPPESAQSYSNYTATFTASSASNHTIAFVGTDLNGGDNTVFLDDVRLTPAPSLVPPQFGWQSAGGQLQFSWPANHTGWELQVQTNPAGIGIGTNWVTVPNSYLSNGISTPVNPTNGNVFYRLFYP